MAPIVSALWATCAAAVDFCPDQAFGLDQSKLAEVPAPLLIFSIASCLAVQQGCAAPALNRQDAGCVRRRASEQGGGEREREAERGRGRRRGRESRNRECGKGGGAERRRGTNPHGEILTLRTRPMCAQNAARAAALCNFVKSSTGPMRSSTVATASPESPA